MNDLRSAGDSTLMSKRMDLMAQSGALHPNRTIKTTGTMSTKRGGSIYDSVRMVGSTAKDAFLGSVRSIRNTVGEVSRSFDSYLSSRSSKKLSLSPSRAAAAFQKKVFQEFEALDSVDHAALLQGHGLPELDRATLQRFLVARKFEVEEAFKMLMTYVHWRLSYPENAVKQEEIRASLDARKVYVGKHTDRAGRICIVCYGRKHDSRIDAEETMKFMIYMLDKVISTYLTGEKGMDKVTFLMNIENVTLKNLDAAAGRKVLEVLQNYFPERLGKIVMWKPPRIFWVVYKMLLPFIDENTRSKIVMAYKTEDLDNFFDTSTLPSSVGGSSGKPEKEEGEEKKTLLIPIESLTRDYISY